MDNAITEIPAANQRALSNLQRRLDRLAIDQLRREVVSLNERLERAEARAKDAESRLDSAYADSDAWREFADELTERLYPNVSPGITKDGCLVLVAGTDVDTKY